MNNLAQEIDRYQYVSTVLQSYLLYPWYRDLPETPGRTSPHDHRQAADLYERRIELSIVESALVLASLRRMGRPPESPPLAPIRSFAYFLPVIEELLENPLQPDYLDYLRKKIRSLAGRAGKITEQHLGARSEKYVSK